MVVVVGWEFSEMVYIIENICAEVHLDEMVL